MPRTQMLIPFLWAFTIFGEKVSSGLLVDSVDFTQTRNGKGELCTFTALEQGGYRLSGLAKRPWYQQYCTVFIRSPPNTKIRLTFDLDRLDCEKSMLTVYNGWKVFDWLRKKHYSLPDDDSEEEKYQQNERTRNICDQVKIDGDSIVVETSQNAGQIFYRLARDDSVLVNVEFVEDEKMCSVFVSDQLDGVYKISNDGKSGICKWYISGAVIFTMENMNLMNISGKSCEKGGNYLQIQSSGVSWRVPDVKLESSFCQQEPVTLDHLLPCKFNRIELHTSQVFDGVEQWATFTLQRPTEFEKEPFTYYCM